VCHHISNAGYPRDRRLCGSQSQSGYTGESKISYRYQQKKPNHNMLNSWIPSRTTRNNLTHTIKISCCPGNKFTTSHRNIVIGEIYSRFLQRQYSSLHSITLDVLLLLLPETVPHTQYIPVTKTLFRPSAYLRENVSITRHCAARSYTYVGLLYIECYFCSILTKQSLFTTALWARQKMMVSVATAVQRFNVWTPPTFRNGYINCIFTYLQKNKIKGPKSPASLHPATKRDQGTTLLQKLNFLMLITHTILKENQPWNILPYKENLCS
jgi:hypothetical protein